MSKKTGHVPVFFCLMLYEKANFVAWKRQSTIPWFMG